MQSLKPSSFKTFLEPLQNPVVWLAALGLCLAILNLTLAWIYTRNADLVAIMALFWGGVGYLLWNRYPSLTLRSDLFSTIGGGILVTWGLYRGWVMLTYDPFIRIQPFILALGLGMIGSGAKRLPQYAKELGLLLVLALPEGVLGNALEQGVNLSVLAARSTTAILWYLGFDVTRDGVNVILPGGGVRVYRGCSGLKATLELLRLSLAYLVIFPSYWWEKLVVPVVAVTLAYSINLIRLVLMTILAAAQRKQAFEFWHVGSGSNLFPVASMLLFAGFCLWIMQTHDADLKPISNREVA
ncbi:cyanoexosortase A [Synechococcales cyanobacterium C]|uniref:Cyanoexosortase A n=1 Tax=Petrachloros mirabilis ULC683 TaxID=2781853 RepID=A0A8K1ZW75_9CYAN|nr:cyanoexosortase A [Petrachloros mirabilis]NCJ05003.1 cyanoexosortase A [Petrachloros mirabilis ULC683]